MGAKIQAVNIQFLTGVNREDGLKFLGISEEALQKLGPSSELVKNINKILNSHKEINIPDIPVQYKESLEAKVPSDMNATIGVLVDEQGEIVMNPQVKKVMENLFSGKYKIDSQEIVKYHTGDGLPIFATAIESLIQQEEKEYNWGSPNGTVTKPYFINGGGNGLAVFRDYFLEEGDIAIVPNYRWPNIDGILENKTKREPEVANIFDNKGNIDFNSVDEIFNNAQLQGKKRVGLYLNFPNNPTGTNPTQEQMDVLNSSFSKYQDLEINIVVDDPYGAYALDDELNVKKPISYMIDTQNNPNVTVVELGSHGTKEAGLYGVRAAVMRGITHDGNKEELEKKLSLAMRQTTSMSPAFPQLVMTKAILGEHTSPFEPRLDYSEEKKSRNAAAYLKARKQSQAGISKRISKFRSDLLEKNGEFLQYMGDENDTSVNGFYLTFTLTDLAKEKGLNLNELRKKCISQQSENGESEQISFAVFEDTLSKEQCIRITLISGDTSEYAQNLNNGILSLIK